MAGPRIITCNAGSSNIKLASYDAVTMQLLERTQVDNTYKALDWAKEQVSGRTVTFGHRVVHGGKDFHGPVLVTPQNLQAMEALTPLAPLHQPANLSLIRQLSAAFPGARQVACFDTAFHLTMPPLERRFALPAEFHAHGIERYGFHGLSYEYIASQLLEVVGAPAHGRVLVAHLGNGSSLCGMEDCCSRATSMGFSTLDGLMMGTRSGTVDAGVILHLLEQADLSIDDVSNLLYHRSGLKGVSGISHDMRELLESSDPQARLAIDLYAYMAAKSAGSIIMTLGGLDALVFTGGIGENAAEIRARICDYFLWMGLILDPEANEAGDTCISAEHSLVPVYVIPTDEERVIAEACAGFMG